MQPVLNIEDVRNVEVRLADEGVSLSELMHRAGVATAQEVLRLDDAHKVVVLAGLGNNGGDGWVAAELLLRRGMDVTVVSAERPSEVRSDLARAAAEAAEAAGVPIVIGPPRQELEELLAAGDVVIDGIFGTGFHGAPEAPFDIWIDCINASGLRVVSIDVPSGLSAQTGHAAGVCVLADITVTMLTLKPGLLSDEGRDACGAIVVAPLAEETERLAEEADPVAWRADLPDYAEAIPMVSSAQDKYTRGSVLVVGGSVRYPGAAMMAAMAAARAGAGYVTLAVPESVAPIAQARLLEIPVVALPAGEDGTFAPEAAEEVAALANKHTATLVGPGMGTSEGSTEVVRALLSEDVPLVVDADGLNCISRSVDNQIEDAPEALRRSAPLVLTPHRAELGRFVGLQDTPPDSLTAMLDAARRIVWADGGSELCVVAKGSATACVNVEVAVLPKPGPSALATAGSGDVLAGIMVSLLAQSDVEASDLPLLAAYVCELHGYAATAAVERYGSRGVMAGDLIEVLGLAQDQLLEHVVMAETEE